MPGPVGSFDGDSTLSGTALTFDLPAVAAGESFWMAIVARDVASNRIIAGVPAEFGAALVSVVGDENRAWLYGVDGPQSAQTVSLTCNIAMQWCAGGWGFDLPIADIEPNPAQDFGGDLPTYPMTTPEVVVPSGTGVWMQVILCTSFSRFLTPDAALTRHGYVHSASYVGFAVAYDTAAAGATGVSDTWGSGDTDGATNNGTKYLGISVALGVVPTGLTLTWSADMDLSEPPPGPAPTPSPSQQVRQAGAVLQMIPPRVQFTDADGMIRRDWYRFMASLYADSPSAREMAQSIRRLVSVVLTGATAVQYTAAEKLRADIKAAVLCNSTAGAVPCSVWLVPAGGVAGADNIVIAGVSVAAGVSRVCEELVGQVIEAGGTIQAEGAGVTFVVTGTEIT